MKFLLTVAKSFIAVSASSISTAVAFDLPASGSLASGLVETSKANENDEHHDLMIPKRKLPKKNGFYCQNEVNEINRLEDLVKELKDHMYDIDGSYCQNEVNEINQLGDLVEELQDHINDINDGVTNLYVQTGSSCALEFIGDDMYFSLEADDETVRFSDRPYRNATKVRSSTFVHQFEELFSQNHPNAAVTAVMNGTSNQFGGPVVGVFSQPTFMTNGDIRYHVAQTEGQDLGILKNLIVDNKLAFTTCSLFIDSTDEDNNDVHLREDARIIFNQLKGLGNLVETDPSCDCLPLACGENSMQQCNETDVTHGLFQSIINERVAYHSTTKGISWGQIQMAINAEKNNLESLYVRLKHLMEDKAALDAAQGAIAASAFFFDWNPFGIAATALAEIGLMVEGQNIASQIKSLENTMFEERQNYTQRIMERPQLASVMAYYKSVDIMSIQLRKYNANTDRLEGHRIYAAMAEASDLNLQNFTKQIREFANVSPETEKALVTAMYHLLNINQDGDKFESAVQNYTDKLLADQPNAATGEDLFNKLDLALNCLLSVPILSGFKKQIAAPAFNAVGRFLWKISGFQRFTDKWAARFGRSPDEIAPRFRKYREMSIAMRDFGDSIRERSACFRFMRSHGAPPSLEAFDSVLDYDESTLTDDSLIEGASDFSLSRGSLVTHTGEPVGSAIAVEPEVLEAAEQDLQIAAEGVSGTMIALGGLTAILSAGMVIFEVIEDAKILKQLDAQAKSVEVNTQRYFRKVYEQFSPILGGCSECADGKYCCLSASPNSWNSLCDGCSEAISAPSAFQCASDFDSSLPCCNQGSVFVPLQWRCPESFPTCVGYVYDDHYGNCAVECASDFDSSLPCCGQGSLFVPPKYQCPESLPTCVNYVFDHHYGTCVTAVPVECADIGDDVYDPTKFSKVPTNCCTGAAAVLQDGKYLCPCRGLNPTLNCYDCAPSGSDVLDQTKYDVVPAACCSGAPAVQNICA